MKFKLQITLIVLVVILKTGISGFPLIFLAEIPFTGRSGLDHAVIDSNEYNCDAEDFIKKNFLVNGNFDKTKVMNFIKRLEAEKVSLKNNIYETSLIESIELNFKKLKKAKKRALKEINEEKNKHMVAYNHYFIPKIRELSEAILREERRPVLNGILDDFIRGYAGYYLPNAQRTPFYADASLSMAKHVFAPYRFSKRSHKVESNNLIVDSENVIRIRECLGGDIEIGHYLTSSELEKLKQSGFDISLLNPGVSALWKKPGSDTGKNIPLTGEGLFPLENEKLVFNRIKLTGKGSPKIVANYWRNGEKKKIKIKLGLEVHSEVVTSLLGELLGFNQDPMLYCKETKIYLGKTGFDSFRSQFIRKYGQGRFARYISIHGKTDDGEDWVKIKDFQFAAMPPEELRLSGFDPNSWDFKNRREYRALILWYGWLNIMDVKHDNYKIILRRSDEGIYPLHRFHDTGMSLGNGYYFRLKDPLGGIVARTGLNKYNVNTFSHTFLNRSKDDVKIWWNDFYCQRQSFSTTTWSDLKWMARRIAEITQEDMEKVFERSGLPTEVRDLYRHKITMRQNEIIHAFDLAEEFPPAKVPELSTFSPNKSVKKGKVTASKLKGHNDHFLPKGARLLELLNLVDMKIPLVNMEKSLKGKIKTTFGGHLNGLKELELKLSNTITNTLNETDPVSSVAVSPGMGVKVFRSVGVNPGMVHTDGKSRPYYVRDRFILELNVEADFFNKIAPDLNENIKGSLKLYRKEFEFIHFAESIKEAFLSRFDLFYIAGSLKKYAVHHMSPLEVFKTSDSYGFEISAGKSIIDTGPVISNGISASIGWRHVTPVYFVRDQFGALHVYKERSREIYGGFQIHFAKIELIKTSLSIIGVEFTRRKFFHEAVNYTFEIGTSGQENAILRRERKKNEERALSVLLARNGDQEFSSRIRKNFHLWSSGLISAKSGFLLLFFRAHKKKGYSKIKVTLSNGREFSFYRYFINKSNTRGFVNIPIPEGDRDYFSPHVISKGKSSQIIIEMDGKKKKKLLAMIKVQNYKSKRSRKSLVHLIDSINKKYSESESLPLYRSSVLPPPDEVSSYRKIYANTRIFINGRALIEKVKRIPVSKARQMAKRALKRAKVRLGTKHAKIKHYFLLVSFQRHYKNLREYLNVKNPSPKKMIKKIANFLYSTKTDKYGLSVLRSILGEENIFVMGNIYGITKSFSHLVVRNPEGDIRFAGRSWGAYSIVPPVQKFLRENQLFAPSLFLTNSSVSTDIFGELPSLVSIFR